jgi:hypothetical protein
MHFKHQVELAAVELLSGLERLSNVLGIFSGVSVPLSAHHRRSVLFGRLGWTVPRQQYDYPFTSLDGRGARM